MAEQTIGVLDTGTSTFDATYTHIVAVVSWTLLVADDDRLASCDNTTTQARRDVDRKFLHVR
jgi:hypothetical protein